jgi:hypothetical protein
MSLLVKLSTLSMFTIHTIEWNLIHAVSSMKCQTAVGGGLPLQIFWFNIMWCMSSFLYAYGKYYARIEDRDKESLTSQIQYDGNHFNIGYVVTNTNYMIFT